jgi:hypothetical protein
MRKGNFQNTNHLYKGHVDVRVLIEVIYEKIICAKLFLEKNTVPQDRGGGT